MKLNKEEKFVQKLFLEAYKDIKKLDIAIDKTKEEILKLIGYAILIYDLNSEYKGAERLVVIAVINMLNKNDEEVLDLFKEGLFEKAQKIDDFYSYNIPKKDKDKLVDKKFKGKNYKTRQKNHRKFLENILKNLIAEILKQKVNKKKNKKVDDNINFKTGEKIQQAFKSYKSKIKLLYVTEVTRIKNHLFLFMNKGKKVKRNSVFEANTCADCESQDGDVYNAEEAWDILPDHRCCKCFWTAV